MKFTLSQLYGYNETKPFVNLPSGEIQWDVCDLTGLPERVTGQSYHSMGKTSRVPPGELPETFTGMDGSQYAMADIEAIWGGTTG